MRGQARRTEGRDGLPAEDLLDERINVGKLRAVVGRREARGADDGVELRLRRGLDVAVQGHREDEGVHGRDRLRAHSAPRGRAGRATHRVGAAGVQRRSGPLRRVAVLVGQTLLLELLRREVRGVASVRLCAT
jgi:hypothetical protein